MFDLFPHGRHKFSYGKTGMHAGIDPGWPHLKGVHYKQAIATIKVDMLGVLVEYQPVGFPSSNDMRINRVLLYVDDDEKVANTPKVG